jgi:hypothetical protein
MMKSVFPGIVFCALFATQVASAQSQVLASQHKQKTNHGGKIESKYDGFSGETVVTLKKMPITCGSYKGLNGAGKDTCVSLVASLHFPGEQLERATYVRLILLFETKDWDKRHNLGERDLTIVAGDQRFNLGQMSLANRDMASSKFVDVMKEDLETSFAYKVFQKIAGAESVEIRVGKTSFKLTDKNVAALRDLANRPLER